MSQEQKGFKEERPWGYFEILVDLPHTKVKRLVVNPGQRLSLQSHKLREEHWVIVSGPARVTLNDETRDYHYGEHVYIGRGVKHRLAAAGKKTIEIIETQVGDDFPEEDIIRYEDDYRRK
jgi:mannose-6-phosphate isomerase-like protein (cupin superfamily)